MKKYLKLALEKEQLEVKKMYRRFDGYEIHLYGNGKDNFDLLKEIDKPILTIHYPISRCDVYDICNEFKSGYAEKVFNACKEYNAGLVIHVETDLERLLTNPQLNNFCEYIKNEGIILHVENCYRNCGAIEALKVIKYLKEQIGDDRVYPLLDTCHLIMSGMSFKFNEMSFYETIDAYSSEKFIIHLNDCIGSGEEETGGIHGTNFYANQYLLRNILWKLSETNRNVDLVLEVSEVDYDYPTNANTLARNVDHIWSEFN